MVNIELRLLAFMAKTGNFAPIQQGDISADTMTTESGGIVFNFITGYRSSTDAVARWPSLSVIRSRFSRSAIEIPDPDPGDTLEALVYETQTQKMRARIKEISISLDTLSGSSETLTEPLMRAQVDLRRMTDKLQRPKHVSLATGFDDLLADYDNGMIMPEGIPWPWPSLQKPTKGMQKGEFVIIAGRPKSRKTFTALSIAAYATAYHHARVLVFSPEMKRRMVLLRIVAFICKLRYGEFKDSALDQLEQMRLIEAARLYGQWPNENEEQYAFRLRSSIPDMPEGALPSIDIVESTGRSVTWMESQIDMYRPDIVIADSFYRQSAEGQKRNDTDWKVMSQLSRNIKDMAMNTGVCLIGTHQLNREADKGVGSLSNLGYSDAFGQDMDLGFRVVTGKINGADVSALVALGGREFPFEGIMINNVPCCDFSEIGVIKNKAQVQQLMKQEDEQAAKDEEEAKKSNGSVQQRTFGTAKSSNQLRRTAEAAAKRAKERGDMNDFASLGEAPEPSEAIKTVSEGEEDG